MLSLPVNLGIRLLSYVWVFSAVGSRKISGLESLHFRVRVNKCKSFLGQIFLKRCIRMLQKWALWLHGC